MIFLKNICGFTIYSTRKPMRKTCNFFETVMQGSKTNEDLVILKRLVFQDSYGNISKKQAHSNEAFKLWFQ